MPSIAQLIMDLGMLSKELGHVGWGVSIRPHTSTAHLSLPSPRGWQSLCSSTWPSRPARPGQTDMLNSVAWWAILVARLGVAMSVTENFYSFFFLFLCLIVKTSLASIRLQGKLEINTWEFGYFNHSKF